MDLFSVVNSFYSVVRKLIRYFKNDTDIILWLTHPIIVPGDSRDQNPLENF